jgi:hypothetical protein
VLVFDVLSGIFFSGLTNFTCLPLAVISNFGCMYALAKGCAAFGI